MSLAGANIGGEFIQEFVGAKLVGIVGIEIRIKRVEVVAQNRLGWLHSTKQRHTPRPWARTGMRITNIWRQRFSTLDEFSRAVLLDLRRGSGVRVCMVSVAPLRIYKLPINAKTYMITSEVVPENSCARIVHVGLIVVERKFFGDLALKVVGALLAAVGDLPCFFVVVGGDRCSGPDVSVAGDLSAVVEIVEHAKLSRQCVLIGRDVFAVKSERGIAVSNFQIAEDLIEGAILFHHVNHVLDGILAGGECDRAGIAGKAIVVFDLLCELRKFGESGRNVQSGDRPAEQGRDVRMLFVLGLVNRLAHVLVVASAFALGSGDEQIVALNRERAGIPVRGNHANVALRFKLLARLELRNIEDTDSVNTRVRDKNIMTVFGLRQRGGAQTSRQVLLSHRPGEQA